MKIILTTTNMPADEMKITAAVIAATKITQQEIPAAHHAAEEIPRIHTAHRVGEILQMVITHLIADIPVQTATQLTAAEEIHPGGEEILPMAAEALTAARTIHPIVDEDLTVDGLLHRAALLTMEADHPGAEKILQMGIHADGMRKLMKVHTAVETVAATVTAAHTVRK
jgi:hypothetical protein